MKELVGVLLEVLSVLRLALDEVWSPCLVGFHHIYDCQSLPYFLRGLVSVRRGLEECLSSLTGFHHIYDRQSLPYFLRGLVSVRRGFEECSSSLMVGA